MSTRTIRQTKITFFTISASLAFQVQVLKILNTEFTALNQVDGNRWIFSFEAKDPAKCRTIQTTGK
jgi:hypothetical protein